MKRAIVLCLLICQGLLAQNNDVNIISYYASDNQLDGRPMIDMVNKLRFFQVYALHRDVTNVEVSVYYGNDFFSVAADSMENKKYWQAQLPSFNIGDAIQRIEVAMEFKIDAEVYFNKAINDSSEQEYKTMAVQELVKGDREVMQTLLAELEDVTGVTPNELAALLKAMERLTDKDTFEYLSVSSETENEIWKYIVNRYPKIGKEKILQIKSFFEQDCYKEYLKHWYQRYNFAIKKHLKQKSSILKGEIIKQYLFDEYLNNIADKEFSGPAINKSDIIVDEENKTVKFLYRYYQVDLRYRKALDPVEQLGIFRIRYIPVAVTRLYNSESSSAEPREMHTAMTTGTPLTFEVGVTFGDNIVSGNDTFSPTFSVNRLGIAIIVTNKLFSRDARLYGAALTYDFNSYASLGYGFNFAGGRNSPYFSFGINQKAFQKFLEWCQKLVQ